VPGYQVAQVIVENPVQICLATPRISEQRAGSGEGEAVMKSADFAS
jgi:hypothetical protein